MPYALFSNDAKLSKTYPTEADVWRLAQRSGLVVDAISDEEKSAPRPVLDHDYEIRSCQPERTFAAAMFTASRPEAQNRFSWKPGPEVS